jgi:hypothetical protein
MPLSPIQEQAEKILWRRWGRPGFDALFREEQEVLALFWLDAEVQNGGLHQYFTNSSGDLVPFALSGLKRIGAVETLKVLESAMAHGFPDGYPADRHERWDLLAGFGEEPDVFDVDEDAYGKLTEPFWEMSLDRLAESYGLISDPSGKVLTADGKPLLGDTAFIPGQI